MDVSHKVNDRYCSITYHWRRNQGGTGSMCPPPQVFPTPTLLYYKLILLKTVHPQSKSLSYASAYVHLIYYTPTQAIKTLVQICFAAALNIKLSSIE